MVMARAMGVWFGCERLLVVLVIRGGIDLPFCSCFLWWIGLGWVLVTVYFIFGRVWESFSFNIGYGELQ